MGITLICKEGGVMLEQEKTILHNEYQRSLVIVRESDYHKLFVDEKLLHSLQVFDAGNYLIKNENVFKNWSSKMIRLARIAVLFHDIGRFQEVVNLFKNPRQMNDHSLMGYDFLVAHPQYNDLRILLPVKHHGHLIEDLYQDPLFYTIEDRQLKYEIEKIAFLVRDADKIANFYLLAHSNHDIRRLFHIELKAKMERTPLSPEVISCVFEHRTVVRSKIQTVSDRILSLICWIFDLNYHSSFTYIQKTECFDFLLRALRKSNTDSLLQEKIETAVNEYLISKYQQI